ncbi:MAG TPA: SCP2 sterol-binding domain-containing protein [Pseudogracilibacillus sp.]|nr:SCP2 sterol-binding domain-containing protein [Pseudogracilibacillus sp.]
MEISNMSIDEVWEKISAKAEEQGSVANDLNARYTFHIKDKEEKSYSLLFENGQALVKEGSIEDANCELTMNEKNFKRLLTGDLNATNAFMTRRLKLKGNIGDALKLEQVLKNYSF